jgi:prepilin-type processing-associated H-X9-DG protein
MRIREAVVASAIGLIVVGLAIPSVQKLREASNRARCINNLRQVGGACHSYHAAKRRLPSGGSHTPPMKTACLRTECRDSEWSWAYHLLPHLGLGEVHAQSDPAVIQQTVIRQFHCPTRRRSHQANRGMLDYAANAGTSEAFPNGAIQRTEVGTLTLADYTDGPASTVLIGEKRLNIAELGTHPGDHEGFATPGWSENYEAHRFGGIPPSPDFDIPGQLEPLSDFGSSHPGVFNAVFADGSVRTIRFSIHPKIWRRACGRNDNQAFNMNDL